jgi:hypothetical protein
MASCCQTRDGHSAGSCHACLLATILLVTILLPTILLPTIVLPTILLPTLVLTTIDGTIGRPRRRGNHRRRGAIRLQDATPWSLNERASRCKVLACRRLAQDLLTPSFFAASCKVSPSK